MIKNYFILLAILFLWVSCATINEEDPRFKKWNSETSVNFQDIKELPEKFNMNGFRFQDSGNLNDLEIRVNDTMSALIYFSMPLIDLKKSYVNNRNDNLALRAINIEFNMHELRERKYRERLDYFIKSNKKSNYVYDLRQNYFADSKTFWRHINKFIQKYCESPNKEEFITQKEKEINSELNKLEKFSSTKYIEYLKDEYNSISYK